MIKKTGLALSYEEKKVAGKVMYKAGYSAREVEMWLGISDNTVYKAVKADTPEEQKLFEAEFKMSLDVKKKEGLGLILKRVHALIPGYQRLDHLVKAGEWFEGKSHNNVNVQVVMPILGGKTKAQELTHIEEENGLEK